MKLYHNYPQHPDAHPERPWWRRHPGGGGWRRTDGAELFTTHYGLVLTRNGENSTIKEWPSDKPEAGVFYRPPSPAEYLERIDQKHPLPAPPPLCGQVWVDPRDLKEATGAASVVAVGQCLVALAIVVDGLGIIHKLAGTSFRHQLLRHTDGGPVEFVKDWPKVDWPPQDHVLAHGPLSPWAPTDEGAG